MGILKSREEFLPVTCAILKDEARKDFFDALQMHRGGKPDALAKALGVPVSLIEDWMHGRVNIPYHILQRLAHEFGLEMPPLTELRRELQVVLMTPPPHAAPAPRARVEKKAKALREPRPPRVRQAKPQQRARQPRKPKAERRPRQAPQGRPAKPRQAPRPQAKETRVPRDANGLPEPCEPLAYWTGALLAAARWEEGRVILSANRRIGQNYADIWARRTREVFGTAPAVADRDGGKAREAVLDAAPLEDFLGRLAFGPKAGPTAAGLPRWAWSNPAWKTACLRGIADSCGRFQHQPSLTLAVTAALARAVMKILEASGFKPKTEGETTVVLEGKEEIERYIDTVGTDNPKLRDQILSHLGRRGRGEPDAEPDAETPPRWVEAVGGAQPPPTVPPEPAPRRRGPRKTLYHGRPKG